MPKEFPGVDCSRRPEQPHKMPGCRCSGYGQITTSSGTESRKVGNSGNRNAHLVCSISGWLCSRRTALWRYINFVLLLLLLKCPRGLANQANSASHRYISSDQCNYMVDQGCVWLFCCWSKSVGAGLSNAAYRLYAHSVTQKRHFSCGMLHVALSKCYKSLPLHYKA